jgi:hypothetical protein
MAASKRKPGEGEDNFYEAMPATADPRPMQPGLDEIKVTAIVTITLTILVAIGLAIVIFRALDLMRSVTPS